MFSFHTQGLLRALSNCNQNEAESTVTVAVESQIQTPAQKLLACEAPPQTGDLIEIIVKPTTHFVIYHGDGNVIDICAIKHSSRVRLEHLTKVAKNSEVRISDNTTVKLKIECELKALISPLPFFDKIKDSDGMWLSADPDPEEPPQETVSPAQEQGKEWMTANNLIRCKKPLPGDLIEFDRKTFSHFAMCYFNGYVFDIQVYPECLSFAQITLEHIETVAGDSKVCISNKTGKKAHTRAVSVDLAFKDLYKKVPYNVETTNCEYYVTKWRYGHGWSDQIMKLSFVKQVVMKVANLGSSIAPSISSSSDYSKALTNPKISKSNKKVVKLVN